MKKRKININKVIILSLLTVISVLCITVFSYASKKTGFQLIQYPAKDGFNITGALDIPVKASVKNKVPLVIFLHSLGKTKADWGDLPAKLKEMNYAVFVLDLRGHGQSLLNKYEKKKYWQNFKNLDFKKYPDDVITGINYIKEQYPEIDIMKIAIIGADIGANTAINAAYKKSSAVKTIILLSPLTNYMGLESRIEIVNYGHHPILFLTSKKNMLAYNSSNDLIKYAQGIKVIKIYSYSGDGMDLLRFVPKSKTEIIEWIKKYFPS